VFYWLFVLKENRDLKPAWFDDLYLQKYNKVVRESCSVVFDCT
jgi:hypothetical protein